MHEYSQVSHLFRGDEPAVGTPMATRQAYRNTSLCISIGFPCPRRACTVVSVFVQDISCYASALHGRKLNVPRPSSYVRSPTAIGCQGGRLEAPRRDVTSVSVIYDVKFACLINLSLSRGTSVCNYTIASIRQGGQARRCASELYYFFSPDRTWDNKRWIARRRETREASFYTPYLALIRCKFMAQASWTTNLNALRQWSTWF